MDEQNDVAGPVIARFPERAASIQRLFQQNREFQEMCLDYAETGRALIHWRALSSEEDRPAASPSCTEPEQVIEQYRVLLYELEVEILEALAKDVEDPDSAQV